MAAGAVVHGVPTPAGPAEGAADVGSCDSRVATPGVVGGDSLAGVAAAGTPAVAVGAITRRAGGMAAMEVEGGTTRDVAGAASEGGATQLMSLPRAASPGSAARPDAPGAASSAMDVDPPAVTNPAAADTTAAPAVSPGAAPTLAAGAPLAPPFSPDNHSLPSSRRQRPGWAKNPRLLFGINEVTRAAETGDLAAAVIDRGAPLTGVLAAHLPALCYVRRVPLAAIGRDRGKREEETAGADGAVSLAGVTGLSRVLAVGVARTRQAPGDGGEVEADAAAERVVCAVAAAAPAVSYAWLDGLRAQLPGRGEAPARG
ncbi:hypothetical protein MMPV_001833 [Pyropia vietnamensis]